MLMTSQRTISIAKDFSDTPGPRWKVEGDFSGEEFLEKVLLAAYEKTVAEGGKLLIDLDGTEGYATSFLEAAFGELARKFGPSDVLRNIVFKSDDEPYLVEEIKKYIADAKK
jgi:hypothetical protein